MRILIKSEMDSRPLLYPLIRSLFKHGSILVITDNRCVARLIEDELEGGFRNVRIIADESGSADSIYEEYGIAAGDYDFEIIDNVGAVDYDVLMLPMSNRISESYMQDIEPVLDLPNTFIVHFGQKKVDKSKQAKKSVTNENDADYRPESKWARKTEEELIVEKLSADATWAPFPSYAEIESFESTHTFYAVDRNLAMRLHAILGTYINIEDRYFVKEVTTKDEGSSYIAGINIG